MDYFIHNLFFEYIWKTKFLLKQPCCAYTIVTCKLKNENPKQHTYTNDFAYLLL